jgi:hypothetical protein
VYLYCNMCTCIVICVLIFTVFLYCFIYIYLFFYAFVNFVSYAILFLFLCILIAMYIFCSVYSVFIVPTGTLRLPRLRFFRAFSSVVRQMPGYNSQRRGTDRTVLKLIVLFYVFFCVNVYCTTATGCQPNCS